MFTKKVTARKIMFTVIFYVVCSFASLIVCYNANAGDWADNWEFNILGINPRDFKDREILPILGGAVVSLATHEAGHYIFGTAAGIKFNGFDFDKGAVDPSHDSYDKASYDRRALYHGGGFLAQVLVGSALTAIPKTRHSDWTLGFNVFTGVCGTSYAITGGLKKSQSDVSYLDTTFHDNGREIAWGTAAIGYTLSYFNLRKTWGEENE